MKIKTHSASPLSSTIGTFGVHCPAFTVGHTLLPSSFEEIIHSLFFTMLTTIREKQTLGSSWSFLIIIRTNFVRYGLNMTEHSQPSALLRDEFTLTAPIDAMQSSLQNFNSGNLSETLQQKTCSNHMWQNANGN